MPLANSKAWLIAVFFGCQNFLFYACIACIAWIAPVYVERGPGESQAALILTSFTISFFLAKPIFSSLSRSEDCRLLAALAAALALVGLLLWAIVPDRIPLWRSP